MDDSQLQIGKIVAAHGIKGWVSVYSYTDPVPQILDYSPWYLVRGKSKQTVEVRDGRLQGKKLVASLIDVTDRNAAEALIGFDIYMPREALPVLEEGEYYWHQLTGLRVFNEAGANLGTISELMETGANDVLVVAPDKGSVDEEQRLIPFIMDEIVREIDLDAGTVKVNWAEDY